MKTIKLLITAIMLCMASGSFAQSKKETLALLNAIKKDTHGVHANFSDKYLTWQGNKGSDSVQIAWKSISNVDVVGKYTLYVASSQKDDKGNDITIFLNIHDDEAKSKIITYIRHLAKLNRAKLTK